MILVQLLAVILQSLAEREAQGQKQIALKKAHDRVLTLFSVLVVHTIIPVNTLPVITVPKKSDHCCFRFAILPNLTHSLIRVESLFGVL